MGQQMKMSDPALEAALVPLPEEDIEEVLSILLDHRVSAQVVDPAGKMAVMMVYDTRSSQDAARMVELSTELLKLRDEAFSQGATKIEEVHYEDVDHAGWKGIYSRKTVKSGGEEIQATTISVHRSTLTCEFSLIGMKFDADTYYAMLDELSETAFPQKD